MKSHMHELEATLRRTGILGRMAFALRCITTECERLAIASYEAEQMLDVLWQLVESKRLEEWDRDHRDCDCLMALLDELDGLRPPQGEPASWPDHLRRMVVEAYDLGTCKLYAGVTGVSQDTLDLALGIARRVVDAGGTVPPFADLPALSPYIESRVVGLNATSPWGPPRPRSDYGARKLGSSYRHWLDSE